MSTFLCSDTVYNSYVIQYTDMTDVMVQIVRRCFFYLCYLTSSHNNHCIDCVQ